MCHMYIFGGIRFEDLDRSIGWSCRLRNFKCDVFDVPILEEGVLRCCTAVNGVKRVQQEVRKWVCLLRAVFGCLPRHGIDRGSFLKQVSVGQFALDQVFSPLAFYHDAHVNLSRYLRLIRQRCDPFVEFLFELSSSQNGCTYTTLVCLSRLESIDIFQQGIVFWLRAPEAPICQRFFVALD